MNDAEALHQRQRPERLTTGAYTVKDFQLEVLDRLDQVQELAEALDQSWGKKLEAVREQRLMKFDSRTLIALGAVGVSLAGFVVQAARDTARQDSEIETTKTRVLRLEQIATTNSEARIRAEVQLGELQQGQNEIKDMIQAHDNASRKVKQGK